MIEYVWAVDVAVSRLAFAFAPLEAGPISVETLMLDGEAREGQRLGWMDRRVRLYAHKAAVSYPPSCCWVEQPTGRFPKPQLMYAAGVVQAALFEALGVPVWTIPVATWKKRTVGAGNATKAQVATWVAAQGATVDGQDEADAYAIGAAGRAMVVARSWDGTAAKTEGEG